MKPNERVFLDKIYHLHGRYLFGDEWNENAIYFINSNSPDLSELELSRDQLNVLIAQGNQLNKIAVNNALKLEEYFNKYLDKVFFTDNLRTSYEYHGEVIAYNFLESKCVDSNGNNHVCQITLKASSEFVDKTSIIFFDQNVSKTMRNNNKAVLVAKAVLIYFDYFGIPDQRKQLVGKIIEEYRMAYDTDVNENLVYDAIAVMADFWNNKSRN